MLRAAQLLLVPRNKHFVQYCGRTSGTMGCGGENELCTERMHSLLPIARPAQ